MIDMKAKALLDVRLASRGSRLCDRQERGPTSNDQA